MKVVKNAGYGGFGLSVKAMLLLGELRATPFYVFVPVIDDLHAPPIPWDGVTEPPLGLYYYNTTENWVEGASISPSDTPRDDPHLVRIVEELGELANGPFADLVIVDIPDDVKWCIDEYDGAETIREEHRSW